QALKHIDAGISGVLYCNEHTVILIEAKSNSNKEEKYLEWASRRGLRFWRWSSRFQLLNDCLV
ncbi:MAG: hypothetical protein VX222_03180, partial [Actinomycetota bacterium]|nr:hypothetical protein [Actinomycetota bacterium]